MQVTTKVSLFTCSYASSACATLIYTRTLTPQAPLPLLASSPHLITSPSCSFYQAPSIIASITILRAEEEEEEEEVEVSLIVCEYFQSLSHFP